MLHKLPFPQKTSRIFSATSWSFQLPPSPLLFKVSASCRLPSSLLPPPFSFLSPPSSLLLPISSLLPSPASLLLLIESTFPVEQNSEAPTPLSDVFQASSQEAGLSPPPSSLLFPPSSPLPPVCCLLSPFYKYILFSSDEPTECPSSSGLPVDARVRKDHGRLQKTAP